MKKQKWKRMAAFFLALIMCQSMTLIGFAATSESADTEANCVRVAGVATIDSGTCGDSLIWVLDENWALTVSGTGDMYDYYDWSDETVQGWDDYREQITSVVIEDGVTGIGNYAFYNCSDLVSVTIADSVASIGYNAFERCTSLETVYMGSGITSIENGSFLTV